MEGQNDWGYLGTALSLAFEREQERAGLPINEEYCWMHVDQPLGDGWSCQHIDCVGEEVQLPLIATLQERGYVKLPTDDSSHPGRIFRSPTGMLHVVKTLQALESLVSWSKGYQHNEEVLRSMTAQCGAIIEEGKHAS